MLEFQTIEAIARRIAENKMATLGLERVLARPAFDSEGRDALRVTVVLTPEAVQELSGDAALDLLAELNQALQREGEERFAVVEYATEAEMSEEEEESRVGLEQERETDRDET